MANPTDGFFNQRTVIDGVTYVLTFRYNARMDRWILDVADANQNTLVAGAVIQGGWPVISRYRGIAIGIPVGAFLAIDMTLQGRDPQEFTLGADVPMLYYGPGAV